MNAWTADDYGKVAVLAPLAVEHLGKAALWQKNPVLVVPLAPEHEASLLSLATQPDLASPKLRTIGLSIVLRRLDQLLGGGLPVEGKRRTRMVEVRNGAMHVGLPAESRNVLTDCLTVCDALLGYLGEDASAFYGDHRANVLTLLDEKRTEIGHRVAAKLARARRRLTELEERLGEEMFKETTSRLEGLAADALVGEDFGDGLWGVDAVCPECGSGGKLFGHVDGEYEVDYDVEPLGNGQYDSFIVGGWALQLSPQTFACNVCKLTLHGPEELAEGKLPASRHEIHLSDLSDDFDPEYFAESQYGIQD
ncbi:hypothetical protein AB0B39_03295 [Micromonospora sp. NPDC049114]|uniref:hypothetical protein n=1 Tax=Micromonospora sp. NPDC049114 TaxID=3155498 RepID=UPI0033C543AC